jgi:hypothetical protein
MRNYSVANETQALQILDTNQNARRLEKKPSLTRPGVVNTI